MNASTQFYNFDQYNNKLGPFITLKLAKTSARKHVKNGLLKCLDVTITTKDSDGTTWHFTNFKNA